MVRLLVQQSRRDLSAASDMINEPLQAQRTERRDKLSLAFLQKFADKI